MMYQQIKAQDYNARMRLVSAMVELGYRVWIKEVRRCGLVSSDYYVCYEEAQP
jgi:hypothetical protein